jgi:hypothetical protein
MSKDEEVSHHMNVIHGAPLKMPTIGKHLFLGLFQGCLFGCAQPFLGLWLVEKPAGPR